jgi:hypothetical protein
MRTRVMNQLHVVALNEGLRRKKALWRPAGRTELESLVLARWASRRRQDLLTLFSDLFGQQFQIITHFQSINANPKTGRHGPPQWERDVAGFPR